MTTTIDNPIYKTAEQIKNVIDKDLNISGIIEVNFSIGDDSLSDLNNFNDYATKCLVGEEYGYLLEDINYELVGCNTLNQTVLIEVVCNAETLIKETDWLTELP
jgi:hypothetical protein